MSLPEEPKPGFTPIPAQPVSAHSHPVSKPAPLDLPPAKSAFPAVLALLFGASIVGAWFSQSAGGGASAPTAPSAVVTPPDASKQDAPPAPATATVNDLAPLKTEIEGLTKKFEEMPKIEFDPKKIDAKFEEQAKTIKAAISAGEEQINTLKKELSDLGATIKAKPDLAPELEAIKTEIAAIKAKAAEASKPAEPTKPAVDAAAMTAAVDLFKANKFAEALAAFQKLPADDARVLYFTALASGFATNDWKGETEATVLKGVEGENAGAPAKAEIDATFDSLLPAQGKAWLASYRAKAK